MAVTLREVSWVTDPYRIGIIKVQEKIVTELSKLSISSYTSTDLGSGRIKYSYYLLPINEKRILEIEEVINQIRFHPLTVAWKPKSSLIPDVVSRLNQGLLSILPALVSKIAQIRVNLVETTIRRSKRGLINRFDQLYVYTPITQDNLPLPDGKGSPLYFSSVEIDEIIRQINLPAMVGYELLSDDLLAYYALSDYDNQLLRGNVVEHRGLVLSPVPLSIREESIIQYIDYKRDIPMAVEKLKMDGYFTVSTKEVEPADLDLIDEIVDFWETKRISGIVAPSLPPLELHPDDRSYLTDDEILSIDQLRRDIPDETLARDENLRPGLYFRVYQTNLPFGEKPKEWFINSLLLIRSGLLPSYTLGTSEMMTVEFSRINLAKMKYAATLSYVQVIQSNPLLISFLSNIIVSPNYSVTAFFGRYDDVRRFLEHYSYYLSQAETWMITPCPVGEDGLNVCIAQRWLVSRQHPELTPLIVEINLGNSEENRFLVVNSATPNKFSFPTVDREMDSLTKELREYYSSICQDKIEPVTREEINTMDLSSLLSLVVSREDTFQHCFLSQTIKSLPTPINPVTRVPFSHQTMIQIYLAKMVQYGLYSIGPVPGLFQSLLFPPLPTVSGEIEILETPDNPVVEVNTHHPDGSYAELYSIWVEEKNKSKVKEETQRLWKSGWFLPPWGSLRSLFGERHSLLNTSLHPILLIAGETPSRGESALEYLVRVK